MSDYYQQYTSLRDAIATSRPEKALELMDQLATLCVDNGDDSAAEEAIIHRLQLAEKLGRFREEFDSFNRLVAWEAAGHHNLTSAVLWYYKWIGAEIHQFPSISAADLRNFYDSMEQTFARAGKGLRPVHSARMIEAAFAGRDDDADAAMALFRESSPDEADDCPACETQNVVDALLMMGRYEQAIAHAEPILTGELYCAEVPYTTFSRLLFPLLREGERDKAEMCNAIAMPVVRRVPKHLRDLAENIIYLTLTGRAGLTRVRRMVAVMLARVDGMENGYHRFRANAAAWLWAAAMAVDGETSIGVPARCSWAPPGGRMAIEPAIERFRAETTAMAQAFDDRHDTHCFGERVDALTAFEQLLRDQSPS